MTNLISIAVDAAKDYSYSWLLAASVPPLIYLLAKKRNIGWLKRFLIKRAMKRASRKKEMSKGLIILLAILIGVGLLLLAAAWLGWSGLLAVLVVFLVVGSIYK